MSIYTYQYAAVQEVKDNPIESMDLIFAIYVVKDQINPPD